MGKTKIRANCKQAIVCAASLFTVCFIVCQQAQANNKKAALDYYQSVIRGTVTDTTGKPLGGVSVKIEGKKTGTLTSQDGSFHIEANAGDVLEFDYVGYAPQKITVSGTDVQVQLREVSSGLNDVVVVGYGTQKKADLTGAVATIGSKDIENRPITNLSSALSGLVPGAYFRQTQGTPGSDGAGIQIRGNGSLSTTSPLIVIDGVIGTMNSVNPQDVESVTVLKDAASAAIYGAQGGNGVILITTKKGKTGKPSVNYSGIFSTTYPTGIPKFVSNSAEYMQLINEADANIGRALPFDSATIQTFIDASKNPNGKTSLGVPNYVAYPNTNWPDYLMHHRFMQNHTVSVSGGSENTHYLLSLGYLNDPGVIDNSGYQKYQFRFNLESNIGKNIIVGTQTYGSLGNLGLFDQSNLLNYLVQGSPDTYPYYNGKYGAPTPSAEKGGLQNNLLYDLTSSRGSNQDTYINTTWYGKVKIIDGLTFEPKFNYTTDINDKNISSNPIATERWNFSTMTMVTPMTTASGLSTSSYWNKQWSYTLESLLRYNKTVAGAHNIGALVGFNQYYWQTYYVSASGSNLIDATIPALSSAGLFNTPPTGTASDWSMRSVFGRLTYNYKEKYLFEANIRRDGSSLFGTNYKYGNFPSVSVGWNLAKEDFLRTLNDHNIQSLKLRASWGRNGNSTMYDANGNRIYYGWQALYGSVNNSFNGLASNGLAQTVYGNDNFHWENDEQYDLGLDAVMFKNLEFSIDWFRKRAYGILFKPSIDPTAGTASAPNTNLAEVGQNGLELTVNYHGAIGDFRYSIGGNMAYDYNNRVMKYKGPLVEGWTTDANGNRIYSTNIGTVSANSGSSTQTVEGHMIGEYYLQTLYHGNGSYTSGGTATAANGPKTGMIRTPNDLAWVQAMEAAGYKFNPIAYNPNSATPQTGLYYGDLIYADNNGDSTFGNTNDKKFMNVSSTPKYVFGFNLSASWKGFDISMIWAGAAGNKLLWQQTFFNSSNIGIGGQIPVRVADNHYYYNPNNPSDPKNNINGYFPRLKDFNAGDAINTVASNFWLYNGSYLKLKNLSIGYTFSDKILNPVKGYIKGFRVYASAENLLTITDYPGPDPEAGANVSYPLKKQYALGVNVSF